MKKKNKLVEMKSWVLPSQKKWVATEAKKKGVTQSQVVRDMIDFSNTWEQSNPNSQKQF